MLRAKAGASILGVNAGVVQNTPGGGVGGIGGQVGSGTGGTSLGAGGAGAGAGAWSAPRSAWDRSSPASIRLSPARCRMIISASTADQHLQGVFPSSLVQNTGTGRLSPTTRHSTGARICRWVSITPGRPPNSFFPAVSPQLNSGFRAATHAASAPGLRLRAPTHRFIRIAKNNRELSDVAFRLQVIDYGGPDSKHVLGPGLRLRKCSRAERIAGLRAEDALRYQEASRNRQPGSHRSRPRAEHRRAGSASS